MPKPTLKEPVMTGLSRKLTIKYSMSLALNNCLRKVFITPLFLKDFILSLYESLCLSLSDALAGVVQSDKTDLF